MATLDSRIHDSYAFPAHRNFKSVRLVIATRHDVVSAGIEALLQAAGHRVVACCSAEDDLRSCVEAHRPDVVMIADNVAGQSAATTVSALRMLNRSMAVVFLLEDLHSTATADLLGLDVEGILLIRAPATSFTDCISSVSHGGKWVDLDLVRHLVTAERIASCLTLREGDVAYLVSQGLSNKEVARELNLSEGTVKMHLHHIYEKLHLSGRTQLALSVTGACAPIPIPINEERRSAGDLNSAVTPRLANGHNVRSSSA